MQTSLFFVLYFSI